ncbi:MAG: hypothetical protein DWQ37_14685 [Planctomycetota bacterium]|nr:MAG: hypothetical protein DWQ37_14685 [Planctomycetota bacterium]
MPEEGVLLEIAIDVSEMPRGGHIQGIQWRRDFTAGRQWAFLSHDSQTVGYLVVAEFPLELPAEGRVIHVLRYPSDGKQPPLRHAGGIQVVDEVLVVGVEDNQDKTRSEIQFWSVATPILPAPLEHLTIPRSGAPKDKTAGGVGLVAHAGGHVVAVANWDSRAVDFYTSNGKPLADKECRFSFTKRWQDASAEKVHWQPDRSFGSYQAVNLVADTDDKVYLIGFDTAFPNSDLVELFAVDLAQPAARLLQKVASHRVELEADNHFRSGGGIWIDEGRLAWLATPRNVSATTRITLGK